MNSNRVVVKVARKETVMQAAPARHSNIQRAAQALSRRVVDAATIEVLNEALARLTQLCYERDEEGVLCNVDPATGRILVPVPWGKKGYTKWGVTASEADALRTILFARQRSGLPLYYFERSRRAWYLNLTDFPDGAAVLRALKEWEIGVGEYRQARSKGAG